MMAGRTEVESALLTRGAVAMTLLSILDVDMVLSVIVAGIKINDCCRRKWWRLMMGRCPFVS